MRNGHDTFLLAVSGKWTGMNGNWAEMSRKWTGKNGNELKRLKLNRNEWNMVWKGLKWVGNGLKLVVNGLKLEKNSLGSKGIRASNSYFVSMSPDFDYQTSNTWNITCSYDKLGLPYFQQ